MNWIDLAALLIYSFGAFAFGCAFVLSLKRPSSQLCYPRPGCAGEESRSLRVFGSALALMGCFWFVVCVLSVLDFAIPAAWQRAVLLATLSAVYFFPPMIMQSAYLEARQRASRRVDKKRPPAIWRLILAANYLLSAGLLVFVWLGIRGVVVWPRSLVQLVINISIPTLFLIAMVYSAWLTLRYRGARESDSQRKARRAGVVLYSVAAGMLSLLLFHSLGLIRITDVVDVGLRSLPLVFLFVGMFHEDRFEFYDIFVKKGAAFVVTILLLTAGFSVLVPIAAKLHLGWATAWVYAITLLPFALSLPWLYGRLGELLDSVWLGRQFTTVEAVKHFLTSTQQATTDEELIRHAEQGIGRILSAPVRIDVEGGRSLSTPFEAAVEVSIASGGRRRGAIRLGRRSNGSPFLSEDCALVSSLGELFSFMLDNARLREREKEQERRQEELQLHASRSELKALRAQIHPHFLFNALNAIAGLIHKDPALADRTVEQLAEVFRYTLRGSESEWARLEEEMEFVQAYLDVERARFGKRLETALDCPEEVRQARIPTMIVQTLVENAVKHGVSSVRGVGRIRIRARRREDRLIIEVGDNGPGFPEGGFDAEPPAPAAGVGRAAGGYGLRNVLMRLRGHYGPEASLRARRDEAAGLTLVTVEMPFEKPETKARPGAAEKRREAGVPGP